MSVLIKVQNKKSAACLTPPERLVWQELSSGQPKNIKQLSTRLKISERTLRYRLQQIQKKHLVSKIGAGKLTFYLRRS